MGSLPGSEDEKVVATQMVIWEIVTGCRNANAPYNQTASKFYNSICANGANGGVSAAYSQIVAGMQEHGTIPSFASTDRNAVVKELSWDGDRYVVKLTDKILCQFHFLFLIFLFPKPTAKMPLHLPPLHSESQHHLPSVFALCNHRTLLFPPRVHPPLCQEQSQASPPV